MRIRTAAFCAALALGFAGCATESEAPASAARPSEPRAKAPHTPHRGPQGAGAPAGGGKLVIPEDDPHWRTLSGLLPTPIAYGEANWDDVRMRVVGHLAALGRDRARAAAMREDWGACASRYAESAAAVGAVKVSGQVGPPIQAALKAAAENGAAWCGALANNAPPPAPAGTLAPLRARWVGLVIKARSGASVAEEARALAADARAVPTPTGLDLDAFGDFEARHKLRVALVAAYADSADPFTPTEPWDYWTAAEVTREAAGLAAAADALAAGGKADPLAPARSLPPRAPLAPSAEELGALCTGDSLVDSAGFAGPRAIGSLAKLGADDAAHRPWLDATAAALASTSAAETPALVAAKAAELDQKPGGIRYYAIKQLRNTATRSLARRGAYAEAASIVQSALPLHNQDWACPNRQGILSAIEGRLLLLAGAPNAEAVLERGLTESASFLSHTASAEASPSGPGGPGAPGGHRPPSGAPGSAPPPAPR